MDKRGKVIRKLDRFRKIVAIKTSSPLYQLWKFVAIIASFVTSFVYAYFATFLDQAEEEERVWFAKFDAVATWFFALELVLHTAVDEFNEAKEGYWTLQKTIVNQIKNGRLGCDVLTIISLPEICSKIYPGRNFSYLYVVKVIRLVRGLNLIHY